MSLSSLITSPFKVHESAPEVIVNQDAAILLSNAAKAVKAILNRRAALDANGQKGKPLVVILAETHPLVSHQVHHMLVLEQLHKEENGILLANEVPHDTLTKVFFSETETPYSPETARKIHTLDANGLATAKCLTAFWMQLAADHSAQSFSKFIATRSIKSLLNDTARTEDEKVDARDPSTRESMEACNESPDIKIHLRSGSGIHIRNHHMAKLIAEAAERTGTRIILQKCGFLHAAGHRDFKKCPYEESLSHQFKKRGIPVLVMPYTNKEFYPDFIPGNHEFLPDEIHYVENLPEVSALYHPIGDFGILEHPADLQSRASEASYLNFLLRGVGLEEFSINFYEIGNERKDAKDALNSKFSEWLAILNHQGSTPTPQTREHKPSCP